MSACKKPLSAEELAQMEDSAIDLSDQPELDASFWAKARVRWPQKHHQSQITAKFDRDMLDWFRQQGRGYQARMNAVLRSYYEAHKHK